MSKRFTHTVIFLLLFLLWGLVCVGIPAYFLGHDAMLTRSGQSAQGVVVGYEAQNMLRGGQRHCPILEFTHREATVRFTDDFCHRSQTDFRQGMRVPVVFNPDDPSDARIDTPESLIKGSLAVGMFTVIWILSGIIGPIIRKR